MKKIILIILMFGTFLTFGQKRGLSVGLEVGPSVRDVKGSEQLNSIVDPAPGFSGGLMFHFLFTDLVSFRTGISFERKGYQTKGVEFDRNGNQTRDIKVYSNIDYVVLPASVSLSFGKTVKAFVTAGAYGGYLIGQEDVIHSSEKHHSKIKRFLDLDYGVIAGVGGVVPLKKSLFLTMEIRNNFGIALVNDYPYFLTKEIKMNSTNFLFGVVYKIGG